MTKPFVHGRCYAWHLVEVGACTLLFYHPAAWWLSSVVEKEREASSDALASRVVSPIDLAEALLVLERARQGPAATSTPHQELFGRVTTLAGFADAGAGSEARVGPVRLVLGLLVPAAACIAVGVFGFPLAMTAAQWSSTAAMALAAGLAGWPIARIARSPSAMSTLSATAGAAAVVFAVAWGVPLVQAFLAG